MTFIPTHAMLSDVYEHRDIVIVGDVPTADAVKVGKHLSTAWEGILEAALHMSGLTKRDVHFLNLFNDTSTIKPYWVDNDKASKRFLTPQGKERVRIFVENTLAAIEPKVVVPVGPCAVQALLNRTDYTDIRGYPFPYKYNTTSDIKFKETEIKWDQYCIVIPSLHPRDMIWSNYIWRFYLANDLLRAKEFAEGKLQVVEPVLNIATTFADAYETLRYIKHHEKRVSIDIEVANYEVSCIGFSWIKDMGYTIPIDSRWTEEEETKLWYEIACIMEDPDIIKVGQNFIFDIYFILYKQGIILRGYVQDTMMASSLSFPDFLKGLGFLGSVHTTYTYWKDQMDFKNIKEES